MYHQRMSAVTVPCGACRGDIGLNAAVCPVCGRPVNDQDRAVPQVRLEAGDFAAHERGRRVRKGSKWIGVLAVLFAISSPLIYLRASMRIEKTVTTLQSMDDDAVLRPIGGKTYTAGQYRRVLERAPVRGLFVGLLLSGMMAMLWVWARRAPLPAISCALALFVVVQVADALYEPTSIFSGIIVKVIAVVALIKGLRAALAARAEMRTPGA
jgi:hypothetical protein